MVTKRRLSPQSVWDAAKLAEAFKAEEIKDYHVQKLHRYAFFTLSPIPALSTSPARSVIKQAPYPCSLSEQAFTA